MAITAVVASGTTNFNTTGAALALTNPAGLATGDLLVAVIASNTLTGITAPTNWTVLTGADGNSWVLPCYHLFTSGEASPTFTVTGAKGVAGVLMAYRGCDQTVPVDTSSTSATATATALTTANANEWLLYCGSVLATGTMTAYPTGYTGRGTLTNSGSGTTKVAVALADIAQAAAGGSGTPVGTWGTSTNPATVLVALNPALPGGPFPPWPPPQLNAYRM